MPDHDLYTSHDGKVEGPISTAELRKKLGKSELSYVDHVWDSSQESWVLVANFLAGDFPPPKEPPPGIQRKAKKSPLPAPQAVSLAADSGISNEPIWFLFREQQKLGPYRYLEVVSFLQQKSCGPDDFIWKPSFTDWQRIRACTEFSESVLQKLANLKDIPEKVFIERRFPRIPYDSEVIVHDDARVIFGAAKSLSEGGAFVEVPEIMHQKGDRLKLHFTPGGLRTPFNCIAEVTQVSKAKPIGYNVKFIYLEKEDRERIAEFANVVVSKKK